MMVAGVGIKMDFCFYCGGKPDKQDDAGKWVCHKCEKLRRPDGKEERKLTEKDVEHFKKVLDDAGIKNHVKLPKAPIKIASLEPERAEDIKAKKLLAELGMFIGTEKWYKHPMSKLTYTDGIRYLAKEAGAYWLIDIVSSYTNKYANVPFQLWRITELPTIRA
ncbi:unnamed protein product, partial [marine sediment metagenome]